MDGEKEHHYRHRREDAARRRPRSPGLEPEPVQVDVGIAQHAPTLPGQPRDDPGCARSHQVGNRAVHPEHRQERDHEDQQEGQVFPDGDVVHAFGRAMLGRALQDCRRADPEIQRVVGADADAIQALHAPRIDDHPVFADFLVDAYVGRADRCAMAAPLAGIGHANAADGELVQRGEEAAVGAAVGAVALCAEEVDRGEPADEQERHGDDKRREGLPEMSGRELCAQTGRLHCGCSPRRNRHAVEDRPHEHVERHGERNIDQQSRAERFGADAQLFHDPAAEVLEHDDVASPAAEPASEDERGDEREPEEDDASVDDSVAQCVDGLGRLDGRQRSPGEQPLGDVGDHEQLDGREHDRTSLARAGLANGRDAWIALEDREVDGLEPSRALTGARIALGPRRGRCPRRRPRLPLYPLRPPHPTSSSRCRPNLSVSV